METSQIYIVISIIILAIIALWVGFKSNSGNRKRLSPLAGIAFAFILAGLFCGDYRTLGYSLIGFGIILSVIDIVMKFRGNKG